MFISIHILPHLNNKYKLTHHAIRDASEVLMEETEISTNIIFCEIRVHQCISHQIKNFKYT